jgi:hypothetical protein
VVAAAAVALIAPWRTDPPGRSAVERAHRPASFAVAPAARDEADPIRDSRPAW